MNRPSSERVISVWAPLTADSVRERLTQLVQKRWRSRLIEHTDARLVFQLGSQFSYRMWGKWGPGGSRRLPILVRADLAPDGDETRVTVWLTGNEGPYLYYPQFAVQFHEDVLAELERDVRAALEGDGGSR